MSLSYTLNNALSGLRANAAQTEVISSNIANAQNPDYTKRAVTLAAQSVGGKSGGVAVVALERLGNAMATSDRRAADTQMEGDAALLRGLERLELLLNPEAQDSSIAGRMNALQSAFVMAETDPASDILLESAGAALKALVSALNETSRSVQLQRQEADAEVKSQLKALEGGLEKVRLLNIQIVRATAQNEDAAALKDQRQALIDSVAQILPVQELPRADGSVVLMGAGGLLLLDSQPAQLSFSAAQIVTADMSASNGLLSMPQANGQELSLTSLGGGSLAAALALRDHYFPEAQADLDAISQDLASRLTYSGQSLLTDNGAALAGSVGLSGRLAVDVSVAQASWRLRDGVSALSAGQSGDGTRLRAFSAALSAGTLSEKANAAAVKVSSERVSVESQASFSRASRNSLYLRESAKSVDSDQEMQALMQVEKAYAANARLISAVDQMLQNLLEAI